MEKVIGVVFKDEKSACDGLRALRELHKDGSVTLFSDTVVVKDAGGNVSTREASGDATGGRVIGLLTGSLVGMLGGPVGVAIGAGIGTAAGGAFDLAQAGISADFVEAIAVSLLPETAAAVVAEIDEDWQAPIDGRMEALGGQVFRCNRIDIEDAFFERKKAAFHEELRALEAERKKATAERIARLDAKIDATRHELREKQDELKARIDSIRREREAKIELLRKQATDAREQHKERLYRRLAEIRAEYQIRFEKLHQAWELTRSALH